MPPAATPSGDRPQQPLAPLSVRDPALVVIYFFNGFQQDDRAVSVVEQRLSAIFSHLAGELRIDAPFTPSFSPADRRYVRFSHFQWNPESQATLARFYVEPSQVWCIQLALPAHLGSTSLEQALAAWHMLEGQLRDWLGDNVEAAESDESTEWGKVYWGSSRLYWALSDEITGTSHRSLELARAVQSTACPACPEHSRGERGRNHRDTAPIFGTGEGSAVYCRPCLARA